MRKLLLGILIGVFAATGWQSVTFSQAPAPAAPPAGETPRYGPGTPPQIAFDIPKTDIDTLLKNAPPAVDQQLRVVDMGKYNLAVGIIHRGPTKDQPGVPIGGPYHDFTAEVYIMLSGEGVLTTGGSGQKNPGTNYNILNGPGGNQLPGPGSYSRRAVTGDIIIIPPGVLHAWSQVKDHVTYLSVRPDPERVLPGGYVHPLLLKNQMPPVPVVAPPAPPKQ
jgi:hypothetical protein